MPAAAAPSAIDIESLTGAAGRIRSYVHRTPVMTSRSADALAGASLFFKCENLQRGGSFKIRGAANKILSLPEQERRRGVVAFSSGNHAQAVAMVAEELGIPATIVMPHDAPRSKVEATRARGARIVFYDRKSQNREAVAAGILAESDAVLVPPFDDPMIMAGAGTAALELLEDVPDLDVLLVCIGGGGLISGSASAARALRPAIRVIGVEPQKASDVWQSLAAGRRITIDPPDTIADGLRTPAPGELTFPIIQSLVEKIVLVSEEQILGAMRLLLFRAKLLTEPSGAVAAAAAFERLFGAGSRVGVIISGGNVDPDFLHQNL